MVSNLERTGVDGGSECEDVAAGGVQRVYAREVGVACLWVWWGDYSCLVFGL